PDARGERARADGDADGDADPALTRDRRRDVRGAALRALTLAALAAGAGAVAVEHHLAAAREEDQGQTGKDQAPLHEETVPRRRAGGKRGIARRSGHDRRRGGRASLAGWTVS